MYRSCRLRLPTPVGSLYTEHTTHTLSHKEEGEPSPCKLSLAHLKSLCHDIHWALQLWAAREAPARLPDKFFLDGESLCYDLILFICSGR